MTAHTPVTLDEHLALRDAVGWTSADRKTIAQALPSTLAWAIERDDNGHLIGLARVVGDGIYALVVDVMVHPRAQGTGLGRQLMQQLATNPSVAQARHTTLFAAPHVAGFYEELGGWEAQPGTYFRMVTPGT